MKKLEHSQYGRQSCRHKVIANEGPEGTGLGTCFDDVYEMNPRKSVVSFCYGLSWIMFYQAPNIILLCRLWVISGMV
jgi:hypothetical protein